MEELITANRHTILILERKRAVSKIVSLISYDKIRLKVIIMSIVKSRHILLKIILIYVVILVSGRLWQVRT